MHDIGHHGRDRPDRRRRRQPARDDERDLQRSRVDQCEGAGQEAEGRDRQGGRNA
jgi:hypothetical protein